MSGKVEFRRLLATDLVDGFDAGDSAGEVALTTFFRRYALQNQARKRSSTWVAVDDIAIAGFVTLSPGSASANQLRKVDRSLPGYPAAVLVLARMATSVRHRGTGIGRALVDQVVMPRAQSLATDLGCVGVLTDAKPEAVAFYAKVGFVKLTVEVDADRPVPMFRALR